MSRNVDLLQKAEEEHQQEIEKNAQRLTGSAPVTNSATADEVLAIDEQLDVFTREQIAKLAHTVVASQRKAVMFTGLERSVGCTWITAHVSKLLSSHGRGSVCLVDGNLRFPGLHDFFGISNHHGLSDAILDPGPLHHFVRQLPDSKLWFLSCGSSEKSAQALISADRIRDRIQQARSEFDFVLVDSAPLSVYTDALTLARASEGVVLVLRANVSRREAAQQAVNDARAANINLLGVVLNQRTFPVPKAIYDRL